MFQKTVLIVSLAAAALSAGRVLGTTTVGNFSVGGTGPFVWTYDAAVFNGIVAADSGLITIYDFAGFIPGTEFDPGPDWIFSSAGSGVTPSNLSIVGGLFDDPGIPNLTWTYVGATATSSPGPLVSVPLGHFGASSVLDGPGAADKFVTQDLNNGPAASVSAGSFGTVLVPGDGRIPDPLPESSSTVVLLGLGLLGLNAFRRRMG